jgi:hypothetical protein
MHKNYVIETILLRCFQHNFAELFEKGFKLEMNPVHEAQARKSMARKQFVGYTQADLLLEVLRLDHPLTVKPNKGETVTFTLVQATKNLQNPSINDECLNIFDGRHSYFECFEIMQHAIYGKIVSLFW